jgi:branched-chain amino acid transport system substrate-binding protein
MKIKKFATVIAVSIGLYGSLPAGVSAETLKIGIIAPMTGAGAPRGIAMAEGAKRLASSYNAEDGVDVGGKSIRST